MNEWEIVPFQGLGPLRFGMARADVRTLLGAAYQEFRKTGDEPNTTDAYNSLGLHLYYDKDDLLEFVETFRPSSPAINGVPLLQQSLKEMLEQLVMRGYKFRTEAWGFIFDQLGIALYAPLDTIEGVAIFPQGYHG